MWIKKIFNGKILLGIALLSLLAVFPGKAEAAPIAVTSLADSGAGSLRDAISTASPGR